MQRDSRADRSGSRRHQPQLSAGLENTGASLGDFAPSPITTLAQSFVQALPSLERQPAAYSHEAQGEMLYEFCAALVQAGIGTPEIWADCGAIAVNFAKLAIMNRIGAGNGDLLARNIEYYLQVSDAAAPDELLEFGKLAVSISCGGCGYLKIGPALESLESEAKGLGAAFYWTLIQSLYRVMRIYDYGDAEQFEERLKEYGDAEDEESRGQYEFPEVERALPECIRETLKDHPDHWRLNNRRMLTRHCNGRHKKWIEHLLTIAKLARTASNAQDPSEYSGDYDEAPLPSLLLVFEDHDAISACFDEESQYMLEGSSEPSLCAVFSPTDQEEFLKAMRAVERFVRVNLELCLLIEEIQELEKSDEGRGRDRSDASLRAA
jgi:hypothetical protein